MRFMTPFHTGRGVAVWLCLLASGASLVVSGTVTARAPDPDSEGVRTVIEIRGDPGLDLFGAGWDRRTFWDLRPPADRGREVRRRSFPEFPDVETLAAGQEIEGTRFINGEPESFEGRVVAEGMALTAAGPREVVLLRERLTGRGGARLIYRFITAAGESVALFEGPEPASGEPFAPEFTEIVVSSSLLIDNGIEIHYEKLSEALVPGTIGFLRYAFEAGPCLDDGDCVSGDCIGADPNGPVNGQCRAHLTDIVSAWSAVPEMVSTDQAGVPYQPDPGDPGSSVNLPEVWDFTAANTSTLVFRNFTTTRGDTTSGNCLQSCAPRNQTATPPDGTWQSYLKIDRYNPVSPTHTQDVFLLNDNDTGANPSIDVPFTGLDALPVSYKTQLCFAQSGGLASERLLRFFKFTGANPSVAVMGVGDTWNSGNWTSCNASSGLPLTIESQCGDACFPTCSGTRPYARGIIGGGVGLRSKIVEDGYVHVAAGNYIPAVLMSQETDILAGVNIIFQCVGALRNRAIDYFWVHERYGLLASVSSPNDPGTNPCGIIQETDWSCFDNRTDNAAITWGPFPPYQTEAHACLSGTRIEWALPADGSNLTGEPGVSDYGYVVSWGSATDPEELADWDTNPNHTPLPGEVGYLAAPPAGEPTSAVITGWAGGSINATVVTALRYTDPDAGDVTPYRSAALYKVIENPAKLNPATFMVGEDVFPFAVLSGNDIVLSWPAVAGASSYLVKVWNLQTKAEIPCPPGMNCTPASPTTTHFGAGATTAAFGYSAYAVDRCGTASAN